MTRTFESPSSYQPRYSLLGRAIRAWVGDRLQGEAIFIVVLTALTLALLMSHYLGWALLKPYLTAHPGWRMVFWGVQVGSGLLLAGIGLVGICPSVQVACSADTVTVRQGDRSCTLSPASIDDVSLISARRYHRHYRRYAATQVFVSHRPDEIICLRTDEGPVIVALADPADQSALLDHLYEFRAPSPEAVAHPQT
ncbi:MAG: hypothetical protein ABEK75_00635 [Salinibacter sp.]